MKGLISLAQMSVYCPGGATNQIADVGNLISKMEHAYMLGIPDPLS